MSLGIYIYIYERRKMMDLLWLSKYFAIYTDCSKGIGMVAYVDVFGQVCFSSITIIFLCVTMTCHTWFICLHIKALLQFDLKQP
jgi:hypothetical protein